MIKTSLINDIVEKYPHINPNKYFTISDMLYDTKEKFVFIFDEWDYIFNNNMFVENQNDFLEFLRNLLKELSQDTREVIILRIYEEMKFKDIAKIMGCSVSTTKSRFRLGVNQLKKLMENDYER